MAPPPPCRGTIADEVTFASVRHRAAAFGAALAGLPGRGRAGVVVGHDARFLADRFAAEAAAVIAARGLPVLLADAPLPAPALAHAIASGRRAGGLYVGGGDLPAEETGVALYDAAGAPADDDLLEQVNRLLLDPETAARTARRRTPPVRRVRPQGAYLRSLLRAVPAARIWRARLRLACDARHGAAAGWITAALGRVSAALEALHDDPRPDFGGLPPTCSEPDLKALGRSVRRARRHLGLAIDADGTHCGAVDERGAPIPPGALAALLADRLLGEGRVRGGLARGVAATHLLDDVAAAHGATVVEVPFGAGPLAAALGPARAGLAVDEAGGIALPGHARERDGILVALLAAEAAAVEKRPLRDQISDLHRRLGPRLGRRIDYHVDPSARERALLRLQDVPARFAGRPVRAVAASESRKWILADGSWVLFRAAADDGPLRCHLEARSARDLETLTAAAREWVAGGR
ncbi:MAG TPA: hypothetical protein VFD06_00360 [Candidatus Polarisedimenticolia bacterium]|nr:hypothetical protein [Candidatus Polarisedimenticolia bacterium]